MIMMVLLVQRIAQLFIMILLGYLLVKLGVVKPGDSVVLSKVSMYLVIPCVIVNSFQVDFTSDVRDGLLLAVAAALLINFLLVAMGHGAGRLLGLDKTETASVIYSNSGNMIIPLVAAVLGEEWIIYSIAFMSVQLLFLFTHCRLMFAREETPGIAGILCNPNILSILFGVGLLLTGLRLPATIGGVAGDIAGLVGPLGMLVAGMLLGGMDLKALFCGRRIYLVVFLRLVLCPAVILLLIKTSGAASLVPGGVEILLISFLAAITPAASTVTQFAQVYGGDAEYASGINVLTTLLCFLTIPPFVMLYLA